MKLASNGHVKRVILVSTLIKKTAEWDIFHFRGFYTGLKIQEVRLKKSNAIRIKDSYLIYGEVLKYRGTTLYLKVLKLKLIDIF